MSSTNEIIDFAQKCPLWQQDALRRIALQGSLRETDRKDLLLAIRAEHGLPLPKETPAPKLLPLTEAHLSSSGASGAFFTLETLEGAENVNALKAGEKLEFSPIGLTLIYGDNGSGKSGYARIFKRACAARGVEQILANVFDPGYKTKPSAKATFCIVNHKKEEKDVPQKLDWLDSSGSVEILRQIRVFDRKAASIYVADKAELAFVPFNLDLLDELAVTCDNIKGVLRSEADKLEEQDRTISESVPLVANTAVFLEQLTGNTRPEDIVVATAWNATSEARLKELRDLLDNPVRVAKDLRSRGARLAPLANKIVSVEKALNDSLSGVLKKLRDDAVGKRALADRLSQAALVEPGRDLLPGIGSAAWLTLWEAARAYSTQQAYPGLAFPVTETIKGKSAPQCVLCQQDLSLDASKRLKRFEDFVKGEVAKAAKVAENARDKAYRDIQLIDTTIQPGDKPILAELGQDDTLLAAAAAQSLKAAGARKEALLCTASEESTAIPALAKLCGDKLVLRVTDFEKKAAEIDASISAEKRQPLLAEAGDLETRKTLAAHRKTLDKIISARMGLARLETAIQSLNTRRITEAKINLSKVYINKQFKDALDEELLKLGVTRKVTLDFTASKGIMYHRTIFGDSNFANIDQVLSEGEHRAVALACFLAEARMIKNSCPLVIDDPVSSLDQTHRELIAKRLIVEAKSRQVIVLTHEMIFLMGVWSEANDQGVQFNVKSLQRSGNDCGVVIDNLPWPILPVANRLAFIESSRLPSLKLLEKANPSDYWEKARTVGGLLRDCWERLVEEKLFGSVILRYRKSIETLRLRKINISDSLCEKVTQGMTRTSNWAHDQAAGTGGLAPTVNVLVTEIETIRQCITEIEALHKTTEILRKPKKLSY